MQAEERKNDRYPPLTCCNFAADADFDLSFINPFTCRLLPTSVAMILGSTPCATSPAGTSGIFSSSALIRIHQPDPKPSLKTHIVILLPLDSREIDIILLDDTRV